MSDVFRPLDLIFALNEVYSHNNRKIILMTQFLTDYSVIKAYRSSVQCKCKLRCLLQLTRWGGGGGGTLLYDRGYGYASGTFKPLPFADQNFGKILNPLQPNGGKCSKICTLKRWKMDF